MTYTQNSLPGTEGVSSRYVTDEHRFPLDEAASALQKEIRRGNPEQALYWAFELEKPYWKYLWKRLSIIASEDCHGAEPAILISSLRQSYEFIKNQSQKGRPVDGNILAHAVLYLAEAPKSRRVDNFKNYVRIVHRPNRIEPPSYALDKHTARGRASGQDSPEFFWTEGAHLENEVEGDEYKQHVEMFIEAKKDGRL